MDSKLDNLMAALRILAKDFTIKQQTLGAEQAIWRCITREVHKDDKEAFLAKLRSEALAAEHNAPKEHEKLFWRDVAQYALAPIEPKG